MSLLKENSRINNCFKYCNLFPVTVTPPEKKSTPPEGQQEWVKVMAEKALKVQDSSTLGRGNTTLWATRGILQAMADYSDIMKGCLLYPERQGQHKTRTHPIISTLILFLILQSTISSMGSTLLNQSYVHCIYPFTGMLILFWSTRSLAWLRRTN